jgi:hypothetical protein
MPVFSLFSRSFVGFYAVARFAGLLCGFRFGVLELGAIEGGSLN